MKDLVETGESIPNTSDGLTVSPDSDSLASIDPQLRVATSELELLKKMEAMNRANEQDTRSVVSASRASVSDTQSDVSLCDGAWPPVDHFEEDESAVEEELLRRWGDLEKNWVDEYNRRPEYIRTLVRRGIPRRFRSVAWRLLSNADVDSVRVLYFEYLGMPSTFESRIRCDISRCQHAQQRVVQESSLFNVMKAYALHDKEIGYPGQSLVYVVHTLLSQMPEAESFAVLIKLMSTYNLRALYGPSMTKLALRVYQLEHLFRALLPDIYSHLRNINFDTSSYASSWFLTFYASQLSSELSNRIMDVVACEGIDVVFRLALAALRICRRDLLQLKVEGERRYFQFDMSQKLDKDHDLLINTSFNIQVDSEKMTELESEFITANLKEGGREEDEGDMEERKVRIENSLLRQRINRLEDESSFLADELISIEPPHSEVASSGDGSDIKTQLLHLRQCNADIHRRLEEAYQTIKELTDHGSGGVEDKEVQVDDTPTIEHIHVLQEEVMEARARDVDSVAVTKDLKIRAQELELANEKLKTGPSDACLTNLKNELTEVRMHESEANQLLRETRQKIKELHEDWEQFVAKQPKSNGDPVTYEEMHQEIMGAWIREADALAELKESRQRLMELETQKHVFTNQLRRQDEEFKRLQWKNDTWPSTEKELQCSIRESQHKLKDAEARLKEEAVLARLKEAELLETIADLKNQLSEMESSYFEKWTQGELNKDDIENDDFDDEDEAEALDDIDSSYHSSDTITEDDFEDSVARMTSRRSQSLKKRRYEMPADSSVTADSAHA